jgi:hypothetical protein
MPLPFDATLKELAQAGPRDFLSVLGAPTRRPVVLLTADLSTVTTAADLVFGIGRPLAEVVHVDCQVSADAHKHRDVLVYNALLHRRYHVPVCSIVLLLRPKARHRNLNGTVCYAPRSGRSKMEFGYEVIPLWEQSVANLLNSSVTTLPLAVLGKLPEGVPKKQAMKVVVGHLADRLHHESPSETEARLLNCAFILAGLRLPRVDGVEIFKGVRAVRESTTYQAIVEEGQVKEALRLLFRLGRKRLGEPTDPQRTALESITDLDRLEELHDRLAEVESWQELLQNP